MPSCIKRSVQQQNIRFLHTRSQYTEEYFKFIRNIATINSPNMVASSNDLRQIQIVCTSYILYIYYYYKYFIKNKLILYKFKLNYILHFYIKLSLLGY